MTLLRNVFLSILDKVSKYADMTDGVVYREEADATDALDSQQLTPLSSRSDRLQELLHEYNGLLHKVVHDEPLTSPSSQSEGLLHDEALTPLSSRSDGLLHEEVRYSSSVAVGKLNELWLAYNIAPYAVHPAGQPYLMIYRRCYKVHTTL